MKIKNYILVFAYLILLFLISAFNYIQDPYNIFKKQDKFEMNTLLNNPYLQIKCSKKYKYNYVIAGGSSVRTLNLTKYRSDIADISVFNDYDIYDMENLLYFWLDLHPETKTVFLPIDLYQLTFINKSHIKYSNTRILTLKDIYTLLFAIDTTKYSVKNLISKAMLSKLKTQNNFIYQKEVGLKQEEPIKIKRNNFKQNAQDCYERIFNELKKRNIQVVCFTVPVSANYQLEKHLIYDEKINYILRMLVEENGTLINFWTINKFTSEAFINEKNKYFIDKVHPNEIYGNKIVDILFNTTENDKDLYVKLTKNNIDTELIKWENDLKNWKKLHLKEILSQRKTY